MLHIVLFQPEIAENTGNIARTCVGFNAHLHLIRPYGFFFNPNDARLKRSGANYWEHLTLSEHDNYEEFLKTLKEGTRIYYLTRYGTNAPDEMKLVEQAEEDIYLMFGKESTGIDKDILRNNLEKTVRIPTSANVRSLNLANCVSMLCYEYARQNKYKNLETSEPHKKL